MEYILVVIIGAIIGSFLNVCIFRIPEEESISYPPSHCRYCKHKLNVFDLIPILSFISLRGKCRYCNEKISKQYPIIEVLNGLLYFIVCYKYGFTVTSFKYCILASLLIVIGVIDYKTMYVYRAIIISGIIVASSLGLFEYIVYNQSFINYFLGGIIGALIIGTIIFLTKEMGEGDIEITLMCGLFLGVKGILITFFIATILGGTIGIVILLLKVKNKKDKIAFGPFLAIGAMTSALFSIEIIKIYLQLCV